MARYTMRTCHCCGIRLPQPQMYQVTKYVEVGKSKASLSTSTFLGSALGNKKSDRAVESWLFNTNQRNYQRKRTVWTCSDCKEESEKLNVIDILKLAAMIIVVAWIGVSMGGPN